IIFHALTKAEIRQIVSLQMRRVEQLLSDQQIEIILTDEAKDYIAEVGYDPVFGARPLKRVIQREIENPIATKLLENEFLPGDTIQVDVANERLVFRKIGSTTRKDPPAPIPAEKVG
ncbi:MAG: ATP-dependent chaperone ClpB, partial [Cyanobacteriota bacterium]